MKSVGPFQAAAPSQVDAGRPTRASTATAYSGQVTRSNFRETLAQIKPTDTLKHRQVQVQQGDTLIGLTRKYLHEQGQTATPPEVHRVAMSVAQKNSLSNPNLIRTGQTLNFSAAHFAGTPSALKSREPVMAAPTNTAMTSRATLQAPSIAPTASSPAGTGSKIAIVGDSIAVGLGGALLQQSGITPEFASGRKFLTQSQGRFAVNAVGGHSSPQILDQLNKHAGVKNAELAIISVGTNDFVNSSVNKYYTPERITQNLQRIRTELNAKERVWVLPYDPKARALVESVAKERGDKTIDLAQFQAADRYHPRNYAAIASSISPLVNPHSPSQAAASHITPEQTWQSAHNALLARGTQF